ncbi:VanZ family protein [Pseudomonas sp. A-1]|uniref:VanZ family protein n=1 Tax=Pseudomonas sp. A-1 TaxID=1821274 RepID=UPI0010A5CB3C|nr:VanZ family protein [Pseudomonas sp. A-1]THG87289.1 VanZ family protein [Pseudomonas sp. A-1]
MFASCCLALAYGLFRPESPPQLFDESDKVLHLLAFACLALTARQAFQRLPGWLLWLLLLALAPSLEWLQHYLQPARQFSALDIAANLMGVGLAWLVWRGTQAVCRRLAPSS